MDIEIAINALGALAQPTRLSAIRLLIKHADGMSSGDVARQLAVPQNTMSAHLVTLAQAGLIRSERQSRYIFYRADRERLSELALFLQDDCCASSPETVSPPPKGFSK